MSNLSDNITGNFTAQNETDAQRTERRRTQDEAARSLLVRANLLRMRGEWAEAVAVCTEALQIAPESASAHALMGDIYEAQSRIDEALPWYRMAVDLNHESAVDREKLERLTALQRPILAPRDTTVPPERTMEWFDKIFPPGRADSLSRLILAMSGLIALILLGGAGLLYYTDRHSESSSIETPAAAPTPLSPPQRIRPMENGADDALRLSIRQSLPREVVLDNVTLDPRTLQAQVEATIPLDPKRAGSTALSRESVLRGAVVVAHVTARADERIRRISVRIKLYRAEGSATVAFVGDVNAAAVRDTDPALIPNASLTALFAEPWWSTELRPLEH